MKKSRKAVSSLVKAFMLPYKMFSAQKLIRRTLSQSGMQSAMKSATKAAKLQFNAAGISKEHNLYRTGLFEKNVKTPPTLDMGMSRERYDCAFGARDYLLFLPRNKRSKPKGLLLMLHGCTQTSSDFARGTNMANLAQQKNFIVAFPEQSRGANAQTCWNWFERGDQERDLGEPAILAGMAQSLSASHGISDDQIYVAGFSAGAAMAVILGETYPDVFAAIGVHSGLPYRAAHSVASALAAMGGKSMPQKTAGKLSPSVPLIIFHGTEDKIVAPKNAKQIVSATVQRNPTITSEIEVKRPGASRSKQKNATCIRHVTSQGQIAIEEWQIDGLGHNWSGGNLSGSYTDPTGPDASKLMLKFFFGSQMRPQ